MRRFNGGGSLGSTFATRRDGGAYVVEVLPRTALQIAVPPTGSATIPLAQGIPTFDWVSGMIAARLHVQSAFTAATTITLVVMNSSVVDDDPSIVFTTGTNIITSGITYNGGGAVPRLNVSALTAPIGPMVDVTLSVGAVAGGGTVTMTLSIDLIGRTS